MSSSTDHFGKPFGDHTLLKHAILEAYLQSWAFKLLLRPGAGDRIVYVDCFAGAGSDAAGNLGSPAIACRAAQIVRASLREKHRRPSARVDIFAIEPSAHYHAALQKYLESFVRLDENHIEILRGRAADHVDDIVAFAGNDPSLYFLDPFGVGGLDAAAYPKMLLGEHNEMFALFSDLGASRLRGVVHATDADLADRRAAILSNPSIFTEFDREDQEAISAEESRRVRARQLTEPAARANITRALGDDTWINELEHMDSEQAQDELLRRFCNKLLASGARYVQVIPMRDSFGNHKYCLVHASRRRSGWLAMKEAVSTGLNRDEFSELMRSRIKDDLRLRLPTIARKLVAQFAGKTVRWSGEQNDGSIRQFLLQETATFDFQCSEIRADLKSRGWLKYVNRIPVCEIPDA